MNNIEILKTKINGAEVNSVNARDIHKELGLSKDFSNWIKVQLKEFDESEDYLKLTQQGEKKIEYILSIETAKHISMMSRTYKVYSDNGAEIKV